MLEFFSRFAFDRVDGLEYSQEIGKIALSNMNKLNLACNVFIGNASTFEKLDDYDFFYLFNPFPRKVMEDFVNNVEASIKNKPRTIIVFYLTPLYEDIYLKNRYSVKHTSCRGLDILMKNII